MEKTLDKKDITIILVDDDKDVRVSTTDLLATQFKKIESYSSPRTVLPKINFDLPAIILTDLRMPDDDGMDFALKVKEIDPHLPVILMTGYGDVSTAVDAMKHGINDFIEKPFDTDRLISAIERAIEKRVLTLSLQETQEKADFQTNIDTLLMGHSDVMKDLKRNILNFAPMDIPLVIYGETGTGKALVAHFLHDCSPRREQRFIQINCAAIPEELIEAELWGYVKGSFSEQPSVHTGKLAQAENGTLFIDEVAILPLGIQAKLLLALSNNMITPIGSNEQIPINCRIVSATKEDLRGSKNFRQDLFFSL